MIRLAGRCWPTWARRTPGICTARTSGMPPNAVSDSSATTGPATAGPRPSQGAASPTAPTTSARSAPSSALTGWPCGAISGGGPHLLACAALLPDLVTAVASLASLAPFDADGLDYFAGMGQDNVDDTRLYFADEAAARAQTDEAREGFLAASPEELAAGMASLLRRSMPRCPGGELDEFMVPSMKDGLAPGSQGWWDDNCMVRPWGFDVADIAVPVLLLHGKHDQFVPFGHGEWLAAHIPGVEPRLLDGRRPPDPAGEPDTRSTRLAVGPPVASCHAAPARGGDRHGCGASRSGELRAAALQRAMAFDSRGTARAWPGRPASC